MPTSDSGITVGYSDEIRSKSSWFQLVNHAAKILQTEIFRVGGIAPVVLADWSIANRDESGRPIFLLRLSDVPGDPEPVEAKFSEDFLVKENGRLRNDLSRLLGEFLSHRSRRQASDINSAMSGSIRIGGSEER
jgi:hypothetical protein